MSNEPQEASALMSMRSVSKRFGALLALDDLTFDIREGEIFGVAGPNGAGKSTLLNVCTGSLKPTAGKIHFENQRIDGQPPYRHCHLGVARIFQIPQIFSSLSVRENVVTGAAFGGAERHDGAKTTRERADHALMLTGLVDLADAPAGTADLMTRKMTMLAAALATEPKILFMDEPLAGLNPEEIHIFTDLILKLHQDLRIAFVVVEHKVRALWRISHRIMILNFGALLCLDDPEEVMNNQDVIDLYLGSTSVT